MRTAIVASLCLALAACGSTRAAGDTDAARLAARMTGTFSSRAQHDAAPDDFFDIRLVMTPVWTERADGPWLYVEQAMAARLDAPYRQRVYHLRDAGGGEVASDVFTLPGDPKRFVGAWRTAAPLGDVTPADLVARDGCSIYLSPSGDGATWTGSTRGNGCASDLRGAKYATSEVVLSDGVLQAWDRGFDATGAQVWGPEKGPYRFVRTSPTAPE